MFKCNPAWTRPRVHLELAGTTPLPQPVVTCEHSAFKLDIPEALRVDDSKTGIVLCDRCQNAFVQESINCPVPSNVLRSQRAPNDLEFIQTKQFIQLEELQVERYDQEIARQHEILRKLETERSAIARRLEQRRSWLAPIRKLPIELLEVVLSDMASSLEYCLSIKKQGKIVEAPLLMASQTCFLWRVIITRRREWWSSASVDISRLQWDIVPLLDTFFDYSAGHPLTIKVIDSKKDDMRDFWEDPSDFGYEGEDAWDVYYDRHLAPCGFKAFSSLVWGQSAQIENLEISTDEYILKYEDLASRSWSFPLLRSFTFNDTFSEFNDSFYNSVFEAPLLSHVELVEPLSELSEIEHLTHLRLSCLNGVWFLNDLQSCASLQSLTIDSTNAIGPRSESAAERIVLPSVHSLSLPLLSGFIEYVSLPAIRNLEMKGRTLSMFDQSAHGSWPSACLIEMIRRSSSRLNTLTVKLGSSYSFNVELFSELLGLSPDLRMLTLDLGGVKFGPTENVFSVIQDMCPNLSYIRVSKGDVNRAKEALGSRNGTRIEALCIP